MPSRLCIAIGLLALGGSAGAQSIEVVGNPVQPGVPFTVLFTNTSSQWVSLSAWPNLALLQPTGELIVPEIVGCAPVGTLHPPGATETLGFTAPATGPGSSGSFLLLFPYGEGAVARVDVGVADPGFPDLHAYPVRTPFNASGHHVDFPPQQVPDWEFANTGSSDHTFTSGSIRLFRPGRVRPVAARSLAGITVPAGKVTRVRLPLDALEPGTYTVRTSWTDPGTGQLARSSHGIESASGAYVDLHFPTGKRVPFGGSIQARFTMSGFQPGFTSLGQPLGPLPVYFLVLGFGRGPTALGSTIVPIARRRPSRAAVPTRLLKVLSSADFAGTSEPLGAYCAHQIDAFPAASGIEIRHPDLPAISGLTFRALIVGIDTFGTVGVSQSEEIVFQ